jgi:hypothetical protein
VAYSRAVVMSGGAPGLHLGEFGETIGESREGWLRLRPHGTQAFPTATAVAAFVLMASVGHMVAQGSSALSDAGSVAAIIAAAVAVLILVWQLGRWAWGLYQASYISHGLHIAATSVEVNPDQANNQIGFRIGFALMNTSGRPLSYYPEEFTVRFLDHEARLTDPVAREDIAPLQTKPWMRDEQWAPLDQMPTTFRVAYQINCGAYGHKVRRRLVGAFDGTVGVPAQPGMMYGIGVDVRPARDERIPSSSLAARWRRQMEKENRLRGERQGASATQAAAELGEDRQVGV